MGFEYEVEVDFISHVLFYFFLLIVNNQFN